MSLKKTNSFIIGISGGSGSGKTTFIRDLKNSFSENEICFFSQDDYYKPRELQTEDHLGVKNFDLPDSIEADEFYRDLVSLSNGFEVSREEYTFNNEMKEPDIILLSPAPIIVVEGLFVFNDPRIFNMLDFGNVSAYLYRIFIE